MRKQSNEAEDSKLDKPKRATVRKAASVTPTTEESVAKEAGAEAPTSIKRELGVFPGTHGLYKVAYVGGGETPKELTSQYKTHRDAHRAIKVYLHNKG